jgi:hypothetical protein
MAGPLGALRHIHAHQERQEGRSAATASRSRPARRLGTMGALVVASAAAIAMAMLPVVATPASAQGTWTLTLGTSTGATTTGFVVNGTVTPDGEAGFVEVVYEPTGTPITSSSPTAGCVNNVCAGNLVFGNGVTTPQSVSVAVDQLSPNTSYIYELLATEDDDDATFTSTTGTFSTSANPSGPAAPIDPPNNPSSNGIFGQCSGDAACVNDMNGVRAAQENLAPLSS